MEFEPVLPQGSIRSVERAVWDALGESVVLEGMAETPTGIEGRFCVTLPAPVARQLHRALGACFEERADAGGTAQ